MHVWCVFPSQQVLVYSKTYCPYCVKAKNALNQFIKPSQYTVVEVGCSGCVLSYEKQFTSQAAVLLAMYTPHGRIFSVCVGLPI